MVDWLYIGYCIVMAMIAIVAAYVAAVGYRALRRLPRSLLVGFAAAAIVATLAGQKTNNVPPNMNAPFSQMQHEGASFQTGFPFPVPHSPFPIANPVQTTIDDIMRGWRVESVTTNAAVSYAMPTNAEAVGNWHVHGAASSFGNNVVDFSVLRTSGTLVPTNWAFPLGTNGAEFSSFWYFIDGRIRTAPHDAAHEICAVGVPMSAVPDQSRLWWLDGDDGSRVLTWENFFLGGDTNCPINAQIVLSPNGDFLTRSNDVETVCRRINPDDWDDDGLENEIDPNPLFCDGDFFGHANILPEGANTNAYCTVSVVATGPDALVVFEGDGPSNYPDPRFVARNGVTNEVFILIGKTYTVSSDWPIEIVGSSDPDTEIASLRGPGKRVCRPVYISAGEGNPFTMYVSPSDLGGVFSWLPTGCGCTISGSGVTFSWSCSTSCTCCGHSADGTYVYEGYWLPATSCPCGCYYNGEGPTWTDDNEDPDNSGPFAASVSATFSKSAVIFEDAYENLPGQLVEKRSERTRLNIVAHGGPNGAALSLAATNLGKLCHISGPGLPLASVAVPANTSVSYAIVYEGNEASLSTNDIVVAAQIVDDVTFEEQYSNAELTSIRVIIQEEDIAPAGVCTNRHTYGVGETMRMLTVPAPPGITWTADHGSIVPLRFTFPLSSDESVNLCLSYAGATYRPIIYVLEPTGFISDNVSYEVFPRPQGAPGGIALTQDFYLAPLYVNFGNLAVEEVPWRQGGGCTGYFCNEWESASRYHTEDNRAGTWMNVSRETHYVGWDSAGRRAITNEWSSGTLTWDIPLGWRQRGTQGSPYKIGAWPYPQQIINLSEEGTVRIDKCGHWVSRALGGEIKKDGVVQ